MAIGYRIEIEGQLPAGAAAEFGGMTVHDGTRSTTLRGGVPDAAALYGLIARLEALGLTLTTLTRDEE